MKKKGLIAIGIILSFSLAFSVFAQEEEKKGEQISITTYYPSPYGVYQDLAVYRAMVVGVNKDENIDNKMVKEDHGLNKGKPITGGLYVAKHIVIGDQKFPFDADTVSSWPLLIQDSSDFGNWGIWVQNKGDGGAALGLSTQPDRGGFPYLNLGIRGRINWNIGVDGGDGYKLKFFNDTWVKGDGIGPAFYSTVLTLSNLEKGRVGIGQELKNLNNSLVIAASPPDSGINIERGTGTAVNRLNFIDGDGNTAGGLALSYASNHLELTAGPGTALLLMANGGAAEARVWMDTFGNVGIGKANPTKKLDVEGEIHAKGDICTDANGGKCLSEVGEVTFPYCNWEPGGAHPLLHGTGAQPSGEYVCPDDCVIRGLRTGEPEAAWETHEVYCCCQKKP